jgi:predicted AlkP superfamily phosphohydrolase/phosphomutase
MKIFLSITILLLFLISCSKNGNKDKFVSVKAKKSLKLYWFIPDGMRAEDELFNIYDWARRGDLPNLKKLMDGGAYGFSRPLFPTHTPINFATLLTGRTPLAHGIADGPMHVEGYPLKKVSTGGFRSTSRKIPAIWKHFEDQGLATTIISTPGSTPPEIDLGYVLRGRWGGWGIDFPAINYVSDKFDQDRLGNKGQLFFMGMDLTRNIELKTGKMSRNSFSPVLTSIVTIYGNTLDVKVIDSTNDSKINYDYVLVDNNKLTDQAWGEWNKITLIGSNGTKIQSSARFHVISLQKNGHFKLRFLFDNLNETLSHPPELAGQLKAKLGPMVDFVDNFPPQLIFHKGDEATFLNELHQSFDWHESLVSELVQNHKTDIVIHNIYSPNQMLTSRWWLGYVDPTSKDFKKHSEKLKMKKWGDVLGMYKRLDRILGKILENKDENTYIVLSSDHGAHTLNRWVHLNNIFAKKGWLKYSTDKVTKKTKIDWTNTKVIYLKMIGVYINPKGLAGDWKRATGKDYEALREEVIKTLTEIQDDNGMKPVTKVVKWENVPNIFKLPQSRVGDLVIANISGYGWNELVSDKMNFFSDPLKTGYKQAILAESTKSMLTPFLIYGPKIKKNFSLPNIVNHVDQLPTILKAIDIKINSPFDGVELKIFK